MKLEITDIRRDFLLHEVSANTDVGNSKDHTVSMVTFATNIISLKDNHVYLYNKVIMGVKKENHKNI
jgi:hypothetical protein